MKVKKDAILLILFLLIPYLVNAEDKSALEVLKKSYEIHTGGDDSISVLTFFHKKKDKPDKKVVIKRIWKSYRNDNEFLDKVILINQSSGTKGVTFMTWNYKAKIKKVSEMWIYLPELRKIRSVSPKDADSFEESALQGYDLAARNPELDKEQKLVKIETINGKECYVIESLSDREWWFPYRFK